jgi:thiosulfate dehydrogenase
VENKVYIHQPQGGLSQIIDFFYELDINSYNVGAGLYRVSTLAGYVKANMPYGVTFENPFLTDEEAWDVAAYINSMPRPDKDLSMDWPDISKKPFDHPFGPYADSFSEIQHKYGPFILIKNK